MGVKWSDDTKFIPGGAMQIGDEIMGLRSGSNYKFSLGDGIADGNGNFIIKWATTGASADNYIQIINGESGTEPNIAVVGADANIGLDIDTKGTGLITINSSTGFDKVLDEDNMVSDDDTALATQQSIKAYVDAAVSGGTPGGSNTQIQYNNSGSFGGDTGFTTDGAGSINITGDLDVDNINLNGNTLSSTDTNGNIIIDPDGTGEVQLGAATVTVEQYIRHSGDADNQVEFGTDTQDFQTGGSSRLDISDSGVRLGGANSRVTTILDEDNMASDSDTALATQQSIKSYVDTAVGGAAGGSNTQIQYNDSGNFGGDSGFTTDGAGSVNITGDLDVDNININGNTISSTDTNGNVIVDPNGSGEVQLGSAVVTVEQYIRHSGDADNQIEFGTDTQDFQTGGSSRMDISDSGIRLGGANARVTTIIDDDLMATASATNISTSEAIKAYVDSVGGAKVGDFKITRYTSGSGTFTPDANCLFAVIELQGAGGGSGGTTGAGGQAACSGSGAGGGYIKFMATYAQLSAGTNSYNVGAGGTAGASGNNAGGNGGDTDFTINGGTTWDAKGGDGGGGQTASASAQASGTPGSFNSSSSGTNGTLMVLINGVTGGIGTSPASASTIGRVNASGGGSFLGVASDRHTGTGQGYGVGSPGVQNATGVNATGFAGKDGIIIITEYLSA